ncbi:MAG: hypothetical protein IKZ87_02960 [Actinomycetaceae bacterium]|nr:hypothetical protein [Actinomycetaceae bacterium]
MPASHLTGPEFLNRSRQWEYWRAALAIVLLDVSARERDKAPTFITIDEQTLGSIRSSLYSAYGEEASLMAIEFALNAVANVQPPNASAYKDVRTVSLCDVWATAMLYCAQTLHAAVRARGFVDGLLGAALALQAQVTIHSRRLTQHATTWSKSIAGKISEASSLAVKVALALAEEKCVDPGDHQTRLLLLEFGRRLNSLDAADIMKNAGAIAKQLDSPIDTAITLVEISKPRLSWFDSQIFDGNTQNDHSLEALYGDVIKKLMVTSV